MRGLALYGLFFLTGLPSPSEGGSALNSILAPSGFVATTLFIRPLVESYSLFEEGSSVDIVHCTLYNVRYYTPYIMYTRCTQCTVHSLPCTLSLFTVHNVYCSLHSVHCTVFMMHIMYIVYCADLSHSGA